MQANEDTQPLANEHTQQQCDDEAATEERVKAKLLRRKDPFSGKKIEMSFPEKLMCILNDADFHHCIFWSEEGDAFCIHPSLFAEHVLGPFFQASKFHSFTRKLNRFSIKRVIGDIRFPPYSFAFQHKLFVRGKPELLAGMKEGTRSSGTEKTSKKRGILKNAQEPLSRVVPGACHLQPGPSLESIAANSLGMMGHRPACTSNPTTPQVPQQARPLSALEMLQHHQLQSLLHIQQHNAQHAAFPVLSGTDLQALMQQSNAHVDYGHVLPQSNNSSHNSDQRHLALPTDADILRLLANNPLGGSSNDASFLNYLQQQFNNNNNNNGRG